MELRTQLWSGLRRHCSFGRGGGLERSGIARAPSVEWVLVSLEAPVMEGLGWNRGGGAFRLFSTYSSWSDCCFINMLSGVTRPAWPALIWVPVGSWRPASGLSPGCDSAQKWSARCEDVLVSWRPLKFTTFLLCSIAAKRWLYMCEIWFPMNDFCSLRNFSTIDYKACALNNHLLNPNLF